MLGLGPSDLTATPSVAPYYTYNTAQTIVYVRSEASVEGALYFSAGLPSRFTLDVLLRCPQLPHNLGDLVARRFGFTVADDVGRGFTLYLAKSGVAISRVDSFGAATALPDTSDVTEAVATSFFTVRVAVDGALGRAYVFVGEGETETPPLRWIIPVEVTPTGLGDIFKIFAKGTATEPVFVELARLRLAADLVVANYPPVADAGPDRVAPIGQAVRFDGRASYDVEGAPLKYAWQCIDAPYGSTFAHEVSAASTADDGDADGVTPLITLSPFDLPEWLASGDIVRFGGSTYEILLVDFDNGVVELTSDSVPDDVTNAPLRFLRQSVLVDARSPTPVAVPDFPGVYRLRLTVNDGESDSEPSEVLANITALQTPYGIEPDVAFIWKALGDEWRFVDGRGVFEQAWIGVAQILSGKLLEAWQHHYNSSIRDAQRIFQRKWIAYRTLIAETAPDDVTIAPRYGALAATYPFEESDTVDLSGTELTLEVATANGIDNWGAFPFDLISGGTVAVDDLLDFFSVSPLTAELRGTRESSAELNYYGLAETIDDGNSDGFTSELTLVSPAVLPSWWNENSILAIGGIRYSISGGDFSPPLPDNLPLQPFALYRRARLAITGEAPFRLSGSACAVLGLPAGVWSDATGLQGQRITDRTYYVDSINLATSGVQRYDLLVINNGESFRVDRIIDDLSDPHPFQRLVTFDELPLDATPTWTIPSVILSAEVDYEREGAYPGDLAQTELYSPSTGAVEVAKSYVVAQKGTQLAVRLGDAMQCALQPGSEKELRFVGVKRRKAVPLPEDVVSVPMLQELVAEELEPARLREHADYILEPFYRDTGNRPIPMLQFADSVFIEPDLEPPDVLWAETTLFSNEKSVEDLFGRLVNFLRDDAASFPKDFNYVSGVAGLLYAQQRGPNIFAMTVGAQILLGQPFAEAPGYIEEIRDNYSPWRGRILVRDDDGNVPTESETVRAYYYTKNPLDQSATSGLALNPSTGAPWEVGEHVPQFSPLGAGVDLVDTYEDARWWRPFVGSGVMYEVEKFHRFACTFDLGVVNLANMALLFSLLTRIKPSYTRTMLVGTDDKHDDLDVNDTAALSSTLAPFDTLLGALGYRYDDHLGDGTITHHYDDGVLRADALVDAPLDLLEFEVTVEWGGGTLELPNEDVPFSEDVDVIDVDGAETGTPGQPFSVADGMDLAAGTYQTLLLIKTGPVLPPI